MQSMNDIANDSYTTDDDDFYDGSSGTHGVDEYGEWYLDKNGMKLYKAPLSFRVKSRIWGLFDGKQNPQPRLVVVSRIALAIISVLAWYMGLPYDTPRVVEWLYMIFGCG